MSDQRPGRKPEVIPLDDPDLVVPVEALQTDADPGRQLGEGSVRSDAPGQLPSEFRLRHHVPWGGILLTALGLLGSLAVSLSFARFISIALERADWIGWIAFSLACVAAAAFLLITAREVLGLFRLAQLGRARQELEAALLRRDLHSERAALRQLMARFAARPELKWAMSRVAENTQNAGDPGDLARLVDRDMMPVLDGDARRLVAATARRVSVITALSPAAVVTVGLVLLENLRLLRALATLYGGQPGLIGTTRLARMVFTHIVATGGVALTEDLVGQFLGQDLMRRLSRRLGESMFNAALTARIGAAAIEVIRPLPYLEAPRVRARDFIGELARWQRRGKDKEDSGKEL